MRIRTQRLPVGYRELEYIESNGTPYIDTGFVPNANTTFKCKLQAITGYQFGCGRQEIDSSTNAFLGAYKNENGVTIEYGAIGFGYVQPIDGISIISSKIESSTYYVVNNNNTLSSRNVTTRTTSGTITIGALHNGPNQTELSRGKGKFYYLTFYNSGILVHNYIPAERCSDGKPGLYDTVNNVFYTNQDTGEFIKGPYVKESYKVLSPKKSSDYIELEYIESTGTQWIDAGYTNTANVIYETQIKWQSYPGHRQLIGNTPVYFGLNQTGYYETYDVSTVKGSLVDFDNIRFVYSQSNQNRSVYVNNVLAVSYTSFTHDTTPVRLFDLTQTGFACKCAMKFFKIYSDGNLVRNFIPAKRKSDNEIGLLDKVSGEFFTNQGTGTFIAGPAKELPEEYQKVEYIESTGTQRISTEFKANQDTRVIVDFQPDISNNCCILWGSDGSTSGRFNLYFYASESYYRLGYDTQLITNTNIPFTSNRTICDWNKNIVTINELSYTLTQSTFNISDTALTLFSTNRWAAQGNNSSYKFYSCKIYDNSILVRDFIPCYRKSDGEIGLYDLITTTFFTNSGTGTFLKGQNVVDNIISFKPTINLLPVEYQGVEYIESDGNQIINTGHSNINDDNNEYELTFAVTNWIQSGGFYGATITNEDRTCMLWTRTNGTLQISSGETLSYSSEYNGSYVLNQKTYKKIYCDNTNNTYLVDNLGPYNFNGTAKNPNNINIFKYTPGTNEVIAFKLYSFKLKANGVLVRDFIPCFRKSDNVIGLYDLVGKQFYTNQGTGTFLKGPNKNYIL